MFDFNTAVLASLYDSFSGDTPSLSEISPSCTTGNCTWDPYPSLAVCYKITDMSSEITKNACDLAAFDKAFLAEVGLKNPGYPCFNYTLPLEARDSALDTSHEASNFFGNSSLSNYQPSLDGLEVLALNSVLGTSNSSFAGASLIYQPNFRDSINSTIPSPIAYQIDFELCIQTYNTTVINGIPYTSVIFSQPFNSDMVETPIMPDGGFNINGSNTTMQAFSGFEFGLDQNAFSALTDMMVDVFLNGQCFLPLDPVDAIINTYVCAGDPFAEAFLIGTNSSDPFSVMDS